MIPLSIKEIARASGGGLFSKDPEALIKGISIDSRTIKEGDLFIAVKGENFDGHSFLKGALEKGASGLMIEDSFKGPLEGASHVIRVDSTRRAMGQLAREIRKRSRAPVICISGTNGKTTVKDILFQILSSKYKVLKSRDSYNNIIGLSLTLFDLSLSHEIAVLELGTNHPGEIARLADIAAPSAAVITNIGSGHLEFFGDKESVFKEKTSLLDFLGGEALALLNGDDSLLVKAHSKKGKIKFFGTKKGSDFQIEDIEKTGEGYEFSLGGERFFIPLEGRHNVFNAAAAVIVAQHFGISCKEAKEALKKASLPKMRLERIDAGSVTFINDAYNANPDSFECALKSLKEASKGRKEGVVAGSMMELGPSANELHRMVGRSIADKKIGFLITVGEGAKEIASGAISSGMKSSRVFCAKEHKDAAEALKNMAEPDAVVLVKGSRHLRMEEVVKCFTTFCTL